MSRKPPPTIVDELHQRRPFASKAQETTVALLRTTDMVKRRLARVVAQENITLQQYNVLRILRGARGQALSALAIADRLIEETPGVTRLLDRLAGKGLLRRDRSSADRRQLECFITNAGLEVLARLDEPINKADAAALESLSGREMAVLAALLARVRQSHGS